MGTDLRSGFHWAVGIEHTFVPLPSPSGRVLDEYELIGHYCSWRDDLRLVEHRRACDALRKPWYCVTPAPSRFDWSWTDRVLGHLERLGIDPIIDLVHYGTLPWLAAHSPIRTSPAASPRIPV